MLAFKNFQHASDMHNNGQNKILSSKTFLEVNTVIDCKYVNPTMKWFLKTLSQNLTCYTLKRVGKPVQWNTEQKKEPPQNKKTKRKASTWKTKTKNKRNKTSSAKKYKRIYFKWSVNSVVYQ